MQIPMTPGGDAFDRVQAVVSAQDAVGGAAEDPAAPRDPTPLVYEALAAAGRRCEFSGRLAFLDPDPDSRRNAADPEALLQGLVGRFPASDLVAAGVARHDGDGTLRLVPSLADPDGSFVVLRDDEGAAFAVMASDGLLGGRGLSAVAVRRDRFTRRAAERVGGQLAGAFEIADVVLLRAMEVPAALVPDLDACRADDIDAFAESFGLLSWEDDQRRRADPGRPVRPWRFAVASWSPTAWSRSEPAGRESRVREFEATFRSVAPVFDLQSDDLSQWTFEANADRCALLADRGDRGRVLALIAESFGGEGDGFEPVEPEGPPPPPTPAPVSPPATYAEARRRYRDVCRVGFDGPPDARPKAAKAVEEARDRDVIDPLRADAAGKGLVGQVIREVTAATLSMSLVRVLDYEVDAANLAAGCGDHVRVAEKALGVERSLDLVLKAVSAELKWKELTRPAPPAATKTLEAFAQVMNGPGRNLPGST